MKKTLTALALAAAAVTVPSLSSAQAVSETVKSAGDRVGQAAQATKAAVTTGETHQRAVAKKNMHKQRARMHAARARAAMRSN